MSSISIKIIPLFEDVLLPNKQTLGSVGYDIHAYLKKNIQLKPMERVKIPTGFILDLPKEYFVSIRPRSGLAMKHGITIINTPGTIDSDYKGEVSILMINLGNDDFTIKNKDRIAQMLIEKEMAITFQKEKKDNL